jgi:hypothetical protein
MEWQRLNTATHWVAKYSYGIYLSHFVVFWIALDVMAGQSGRVLVSGSGVGGGDYCLLPRDRETSHRERRLAGAIVEA